MANWFGWTTSSDISAPDDLERQDEQHIQEYIDSYMDAAYPEFEPEVVHRMDSSGEIKDYYLPALKALWFDGKDFFSPQKDTKWEGMELAAECYQLDLFKGYTKSPHSAPHDGCDCGIYGSVNIEEVNEWKDFDYMAHTHVSKYSHYGVQPTMFWIDDITDPSEVVAHPSAIEEPEGRMVLCVIEPSVDATVHLARKGWKASNAFISEIIGETISIEDATEILSLAWKRQINVRGVFNENR